MPGLKTVDCMIRCICWKVEIERLHRARKQGKVLINVSEEIIKKYKLTIKDSIWSSFARNFLA